jgi:predicted small metal-binding protein
VDARHSLFSELDGTALFHRDTALGRVFHPGTLSYREIATRDSLHITVSPENRVSVHVDRLSPLAVRPGRPCRYSFPRAVAHNVVHVAEAVALLYRRRRLGHRCELDCEVVAVEASPERVYEFSCKAAGAEVCRWSTRATSEEELVAEVAEHARRVHRVKTVSDTIAAYALDVARTSGATG